MEEPLKHHRRPESTPSMKNFDAERMQAEEALRSSEDRYQVLFSNMSEGFALHEIITDDQGRPVDYRFLDVNPAFERLTGLKRADLIGRCVKDVLPGTEAFWIETYGRVALTGEPANFDSYSAVLGRWYEVLAYRSAPRQFAVVFSDITERKKTEETVRASEARYRSLFEGSALPVWEEDFSEVAARFSELRAAGVRDFRSHLSEHPEEVRHLAGMVKIVDVSPASLGVFDVRSKEELLTNLPSFFREASWDLFREEMIALAEGKTVFRCEMPIVCVRGEARVVLLHLAVAPGFEETLSRVLVTFLDITETKRAEEALRESLKEKDVLMRELAHRTKNNMQVIASLLDLQAGSLEGEKYAETLANTRNRILAMALVHEKIYRSGNVSRLRMNEYVEDLVTSLLTAHQGSQGSTKPALDLEVFEVSIDTALPCGLIINELVSNSMKHAFPGREPGTIAISLRRDREMVELAYRDDGPGLPPDLDLSRIRSLGLKLVYNLAVYQLRGSMEYRRHPEPELVFTFRDVD